MYLEQAFPPEHQQLRRSQSGQAVSPARAQTPYRRTHNISRNFATRSPCSTGTTGPVTLNRPQTPRKPFEHQLPNPLSTNTADCHALPFQRLLGCMLRIHPSWTPRRPEQNSLHSSNFLTVHFIYDGDASHRRLLANKKNQWRKEFTHWFLSTRRPRHSFNYSARWPTACRHKSLSRQNYVSSASHGQTITVHCYFQDFQPAGKHHQGH